MATFTYGVDWDAEEDAKPRVLSANFGNGYEQRVADGLNWKPRVWNVSFSLRDNTETTAITAFFELHGGVTPFDWTPPIGAAGKWLCRNWKTRAVNYDAYTITTQFEEVFE